MRATGVVVLGSVVLLQAGVLAHGRVCGADVRVLLGTGEREAREEDEEGAMPLHHRCKRAVSRSFESLRHLSVQRRLKKTSKKTQDCLADEGTTENASMRIDAFSVVPNTRQ